MTDISIEKLLSEVAQGSISTDEAAAALRARQAQPLGFATLDHHRAQRCGVPEVVYAAGKTPEQVTLILGQLLEHQTGALATRCGRDHLAAIEAAFPDRPMDADAGAVLIGDPPAPTPNTRVAPAIPIVTAGTSDSRVAHEARLTCKALGHPTHLIQDVGVAGLHRLIERLPELEPARVIICIAGMEGALPSVVGGLVNCPVVAVPTSVGYGANLNGLTALLGMLTSCASGVVTVNIDNGFGAAYTASLINQTQAPLPSD